MDGLEDESEGTFELLDNGFDELGEVKTLVGLGVVDVFAKDGDGLSVGVGPENVAALLEDKLELLVIGNNTVCGQRARAFDSLCTRENSLRASLTWGWQLRGEG
jgi:hypothetical protein